MGCKKFVLYPTTNFDSYSDCKGACKKETLNYPDGGVCPGGKSGDAAKNCKNNMFQCCYKNGESHEVTDASDTSNNIVYASLCKGEKCDAKALDTDNEVVCESLGKWCFVTECGYMEYSSGETLFTNTQDCFERIVDLYNPKKIRSCKTDADCTRTNFNGEPLEACGSLDSTVTYCENNCFYGKYCNDAAARDCSNGKLGPCDDDGYCHSDRSLKCSSECNTNPYFLGDDDVLQCAQCNEYYSNTGDCSCNGVNTKNTSYDYCGSCTYPSSGCGQCNAIDNRPACENTNPCNPSYCAATGDGLCSDTTCGYHSSESDCGGCCYRNTSIGQCDDEDQANETSCLNYGNACYAKTGDDAKGCNDARCAAASTCGGCCTGNKGQCGDDPYNRDEASCEGYDGGGVCTWQASSCATDCGWNEEGCKWIENTHDCVWDPCSFTPTYTSSTSLQCLPRYNYQIENENDDISGFCRFMIQTCDDDDDCNQLNSYCYNRNNQKTCVVDNISDYAPGYPLRSMIDELYPDE